MRKKIIILSLFILTLILMTLPKQIFAETFTGLIDDQANLVMNEKNNLENQANVLAQEIKASVFVVTTETNNEKPGPFAKSYLASKIGAGQNGVVLLIDMGQREVYLWGTGNMEFYLTQSRINSALDDIQPNLTNQTYTQAIVDYFEHVQSAVRDGVPGGRKYSVNEETGKITFYHQFKIEYVAFAAFIALIIPGLFAWSIQRRYQMKDSSAKVRYNLNQNSQLNLTNQQDLLVNRFVTTRHIPRNNNSGGFGGGGMSGGSGGGRSF
ncbi:TPM domain-containing protein [Lactococcus fujiensis]|nr:TPM domain-containing protein [Lactococcus fujiensis]